MEYQNGDVKNPPAGNDNWNYSSRDEFYKYYADQSMSEATFRRFLDIRNKILQVIDSEQVKQHLQVADVGCGAGTQCMLWTELGHQVYGVDINQRLINLAQERAANRKLQITFSVGSATDLPWPDQSMNVCLVPELLEHVADWKSCLDEFARILKPGGVLFLTTTNKLCPIQQEFNLPLYSWYPGFIKRKFENMAITTHPSLANYATYPAVNWFSFYSLRNALAAYGFVCMDKFDTFNATTRWQSVVLGLIRNIPLLRWLAHVLTPYTQVIAIKRG
jgi:2-polyprenyl-6-hydroxyphenyl methylase/3-demethylubiquinone-9 3-methyltransferase